MTETPRETREKLIMQRYEKKLNRDELLRLLEWDEVLNSEKKEEIKAEIIEDFYENFGKAKESKEFKDTDEMSMKIKRTKRQIIKKESELAGKRKSSEKPLQEIGSQMLEIAKVAMLLEDGSFWKKLKLKKTNEKRDELQRKKSKIKGEIFKLIGEKESLLSQLKEQEENYGPKIRRQKIEGRKLGTITKPHEDLRRQVTLKGYKEKYFQIIKDKEEFLQNFLIEMESVDLGLSDEKKKKVIELLKTSMEKEIESMKGGDKITNLADETEKWLKENVENRIKKINELEGKIKEKDEEIKKIAEKGEGLSTDDVFQIKGEEFKLREELFALKNEQGSIKAELDEKLRSYDGTSVDWIKEMQIETWDEKLEREKREKEEKEKLKSDTDAILKDLKENHVEVWENVEMMGYEGKRVKITLPAVGNFEKYEFSYFVSYVSVAKEDFENNTELENKSHSMKDVSKLLQAMNKYMIELKGNNDGNMNFEDKLKIWGRDCRGGCVVGDCLKEITGLCYKYWLSDKDVEGRKGSRTVLQCWGKNCHFGLLYHDACLFMR